MQRLRPYLAWTVDRIEAPSRLGRSGLQRQQIGPALAGERAGLVMAPLGDAFVIAGQEDFGDFQALPVARAGVLREIGRASCRERV